MVEDQKYVFCRLCLQSADSPIDIFDPKGRNGFMIWEVITELIAFEISPNDGWPTNICGSCMEKLTDYKTFKSMSINSRTLFLKLHARQESRMPKEGQEKDPGDQLAMDTLGIERIKDEPREEGESIESQDPLEMEESDKCASLEIYLPSHCHPEEIHRDVEDGAESEITVKMEAGELRDPLETDFTTFAEVQSEEETVEPEAGIESQVLVKMEELEGDVGGSSVDVFPGNAGVKLEGTPGYLGYCHFSSEEVIERDLEKRIRSEEVKSEFLGRSCINDRGKRCSDPSDSPAEGQREALSEESLFRSWHVRYNRSQSINHNFTNNKLDFCTITPVGSKYEPSDKLIAGGTQGIVPVNVDGMEAVARERWGNTHLDVQERNQLSVSGIDVDEEKGTKGDENALLPPLGSEEKNERKNRIKTTLVTIETKQSVSEEGRGNQAEEVIVCCSGMNCQTLGEDEEKDLKRKNTKWDRRRSTRSKEERQERRKMNKRHYMKMRLATMTDEEKREYNNRMSECRKRSMARMNEEEKKCWKKLKSESMKRWRASLTEEERRAYYRRKNESRNERRAKMTEEQRMEYNRRQNERRRIRIASMNREGKEEFHTRDASLTKDLPSE